MTSKDLPQDEETTKMVFNDVVIDIINSEEELSEV